MLDTEQYLPAGPRWPVAVQTLVWGARPLWFADHCARRYGDAFTTRLPGGARMVHVSRPDAVAQVFALAPDDFRAAEVAGVVLEPFVGARSVLLLDGEVHRRERRLLARAFHGEALSSHASAIAGVARRELATWPAGRPFPVLPRMSAVTLEVVLRVVFGADGDALGSLVAPLRRYLRLGGSFAVLAPPLRRPLGGWSPWGRFSALRAEVLAAVDAHVDERRRDPRLGERTDVLSALLRARDDEGRPLPGAHVRDELMTVLLAGHDTTATALAWAFDLLAHHPAVQERLRADLDGPYLDATVKEVLRLRPVIPEVGRQLARPVVVGGHAVPAGASVVANVHLAHRRPETYPDPLAFRPERFLDGGAPDPYAWLPFGGGVRRCIGAAFATLEVQTVLRTVLAELVVAPARARPEPARRRVVTLVPRHGAPVVVRPR